MVIINSRRVLLPYMKGISTTATFTTLELVVGGHGVFIVGYSDSSSMIIIVAICNEIQKALRRGWGHMSLYIILLRCITRRQANRHIYIIRIVLYLL